MRPDQERVRNLLTDTVTLLCKNGLQYQTELRVQGVLGITLDDSDVFIVHINEKFGDAIGGALTIRNDEGDAAKTLLGTRPDARKSHDASRGDTPIAVSTKTGEVVHRRRRRSRESSVSPALPTNSSQQHILQRPIKRLLPSNSEASPSGVRNRSTLKDSIVSEAAVPGSDGVTEVKVKTEEDVIIVEQRQHQDDRAETSVASLQDIPHANDQSAMQDSYPNLTLSELQGSYQPFGEILGVTDNSTNSGVDGTAPPTKRRATTGNTQDSFGGSSEMGPTADVGGPFITGIIRNETLPGNVAPQTTTATSWDPSQMPDMSSLMPQDSQMISDNIPGCSTWDTSQQSQVSAMTTTTHTVQNISDQSSESVVTGGSADCFTSGQWCEDNQLTCKLTTHLAGRNSKNYPQIDEHDRHQCTDCGSVFTGKKKLQYHIRIKHCGKRFVCLQCQCTFASGSGLREHVKHIHQKLARYQCQTCGKGYSHRSNYDDHVAVHTGVKRNVCPICQAHFTFKPSLKTHILRFHPNDASRVCGL